MRMCWGWPAWEHAAWEGSPFVPLLLPPLRWPARLLQEGSVQEARRVGHRGARADWSPTCCLDISPQSKKKKKKPLMLQTTRESSSRREEKLCGSCFNMQPLWDSDIYVYLYEGDSHPPSLSVFVCAVVEVIDQEPRVTWLLPVLLFICNLCLDLNFCTEQSYAGVPTAHTHTACISWTGRPFFSDVTAYPDVSNYFGDYNVLITNRNDGVKDKNKIQIVLN